jgi:hypothetical protein
LAEYPVDFVTRAATRGWGFLQLKLANNQFVMEREIDRVIEEYAQ